MAFGAPADRRPEAALHLAATPIGSARDITLTTLDLLAEAEVLVAEDTRRLRQLMQIHGVSLGGRPVLSYHDHSGPRDRDRILAHVSEGRSVVYVSDAGTPLVADPGYRLAQDAIARELAVRAAPGPSAALAALVVSGLPSDRFLFAGFPPPTGRQAWLKQQAEASATVVLYETARRVHELLSLVCDTFGETCPVALCRELTKRHEEVVRGPAREVLEQIEGRTLKGEIVLVLGTAETVPPSVEEIESALRDRLGRMRTKAAAAEVAELFGLPKRDVYAQALAIEGKGRK